MLTLYILLNCIHLKIQTMFDVQLQKIKAMHVKRINEVRSRNHCCRGRAISITYSEYVSVDLVIQQQSACAVLYCHLWPVLVLRYFSTLSHKRQDYLEKVIAYTMCADFL
jgi:hypothetical protein